MPVNDCTCSVDGCANAAHSRQLCNKHYLRLWKTGSTDCPSPRHPTKGPCSVADCGRPAHARGWCNKHHKRWLTHGTTTHLSNSEKTCTVEGCDDPVLLTGLCAFHKRRQRYKGTPVYESRLDPIEERLWRDVNKDGPEWFGTRCWVWTGLITSNGYGSVGHEGKSKPAHRLAFRLSGGAVKRGQEMDHLCRNRACVNPSHLEAVLPLVNALRGAGAGGEPHWPTGQSSPGVPTWDGCGCRACKEGVG
jgi:hypothetical protein